MNPKIREEDQTISYMTKKLQLRLNTHLLGIGTTGKMRVNWRKTVFWAMGGYTISKLMSGRAGKYYRRGILRITKQ